MAYKPIPTKTEEGEKRAVASDTSARDIMKQILMELKKLNAHFALINDTEIQEDDILEG